MLADILPGFLQGSWNDVAFPSTWPAAAACSVPVLFLTLLGWQVLCYSRSPLRRYPGPFLAGTFLDSHVTPQALTCVGRNHTVLSAVR